LLPQIRIDNTGATRSAVDADTVDAIENCGFRWGDGKLLIADWAARQPGVSGVEPERWTSDRSRRADVLITFTGGARLAVELQTRPLTDADWTARHRDYMQQGIVDLWLWHPHVARPGILLDQHVDLWFLDVAEHKIGVPLGQAHQRPADWREAPDVGVYTTHHPPCLTDRIVRRWCPLPQFALHPNGLGLPATLKAELTAERDQLLRSPHRHPPRRIDCGATTSSEVALAMATPGLGIRLQPTTELYVPPPTASSGTCSSSCGPAPGSPERSR
jgi:hypothetical protein